MTDKQTLAFPNIGASIGDDTGMTLRDYFAAKAMQAMLSDAQVLQIMMKGPLGPSSELADSAYSMADAMLEQRNK